MGLGSDGADAGRRQMGEEYLASQVAPAGLESPDSSLLLPESFQVSEIFGPTYSAFV